MTTPALVSPAVPTAEVNGQSIYYEVHGAGEPLLCMMGLAADTLSWALQVPAFASRHRTVIFDNRDVGQSSLSRGDYTTADMADDALALAESLGLDRFHLLGVSMGGAIAQELALAAPDRVLTLTLAVSWAGGGQWARTWARSWSRRARRMSREELVDELMLLTLSEDFFEKREAVAWLRNAILSNPHPQSPEGFARQLEAGSRHDARDRLRSLALPVHVIGAEHDILVPVWKARELAELIPGARLTILPSAPHGLQLERAEEFNGAVLDFIAEQATARV